MTELQRLPVTIIASIKHIPRIISMFDDIRVRNYVSILERNV